jgi:IstB-like ATP binding protein
LDEFGYVQLDARGSELLFQILAEREEKSSIALASNLPFSKAHRFAPTYARCRLKCTCPLLVEFKSPNIDVVGEVADEALGFHAERFAGDLRVQDGDEADDPR